LRRWRAAEVIVDEPAVGLLDELKAKPDLAQGRLKSQPGLRPESRVVESVAPGLERKRERRIAIIKAALEALREKGLAETRMIDIARRVGMSPGHVLYYFPSKKALLMAALQWNEELFYRQAANELAKLSTAWDRIC